MHMIQYICIYNSTTHPHTNMQSKKRGKNYTDIKFLFIHILICKHAKIFQRWIAEELKFASPNVMEKKPYKCFDGCISLRWLIIKLIKVKNLFDTVEFLTTPSLRISFSRISIFFIINNIIFMLLHGKIVLIHKIKPNLIEFFPLLFRIPPLSTSKSIGIGLKTIFVPSQKWDMFVCSSFLALASARFC